MPSTQGLLSVGVPPQPSWFLHLKIAILALSLIILALAAWAVATLGDVARYGASGAGGFMIFVVWPSCLLVFFFFFLLRSCRCVITRPAGLERLT